MKYAIITLSMLVSAGALPSHYPYPIHPGVGAIYKGPNSETIIEGPDGSVITAEEDAAGVIGVDPGVAHEAPAPVLVQGNPLPPIINQEAVAVQSPPVVLSTNPIVVPDLLLVDKDPKIVEEHVLVGTKIISVPKIVEEDSDLIGPSGTISTRGGDVVISGPSSTTIKGGGVVASIEKQQDIPVKAVELKPAAVPAIIKPIEPAVVVAPVPGSIVVPAPVVEQETIISTGPVITEARPIIGPIRRPQIYAPEAPILAARPVLSNVVPGLNPIISHPPAIIKSDPVLLPHPQPHQNIAINPHGLISDYAPRFPPLFPGKPLYHGPF